MALEELQRLFPIGTRWMMTANDRTREATVVGYEADPVDGWVWVVVRSAENLGAFHYESNVWDRIAEPTPCPIVEAERFRIVEDPEASPYRTLSRGLNGTPITLHPADANLASLGSWAPYTWENR
ncbi:MAG: hypothetical protein K0R44_5 [Thermomicrobiales bacterium]|jgi:hypothetical protein|nr:hypothetical protein [Thermomicrobiales bacterium]MDF3014780.1 hypothetical protein [Thermomicrobiales bacterium]